MADEPLDRRLVQEMLDTAHDVLQKSRLTMDESRKIINEMRATLEARLKNGFVPEPGQ